MQISGMAYALANRLARPTSGRPIFVTGNGRSGTTWIGQTLGRPADVLYYREPCHPYRNGIHEDDAANRIWARYLRPGDRDPFFERTLGHAFRGWFWPGGGHPLSDYRKRIGARPRVLVKEVASFLSAEWVADRWDPQMLVILRHPGAYAVSVRNMDRPERELARLAVMRADEKLREDLIGDLEAHLARVETPLEASLATWGIRTRAALAALDRHPDWGRVHYEDVARDPVAGFRDLYVRLGLAWSDAIEAWIREKTTSTREGHFTTSRVSQERIDAWRHDLTPEEKDRARRVLEPFGLPVYSAPEDWDTAAV